MDVGCLLRSPYFADQITPLSKFQTVSLVSYTHTPSLPPNAKHQNQMNPQKTHLLIISTFLLLSLAHPIPTQSPAPASTSLTQHLGRAGLVVLTLGGLLTLAAGGITYATGWLNRYKALELERKGNMTLWRMEMETRDREHGMAMRGVDAVLGVMRGYTEGNHGEGKDGEFDPFGLVEEVEKRVEDAQIRGVEMEE